MLENVTVAVSYRAQCADGPYWGTVTQSVLRVDIVGKQGLRTRIGGELSPPNGRRGGPARTGTTPSGRQRGGEGTTIAGKSSLESTIRLRRTELCQPESRDSKLNGKL